MFEIIREGEPISKNAILRFGLFLILALNKMSKVILFINIRDAFSKLKF